MLFDDLADVWVGFWDLCGSRKAMMDLLPLSEVDIQAWGSIHGIEGDDMVEAYRLFKAMDAIYLDHHYSKKG